MARLLPAFVIIHALACASSAAVVAGGHRSSGVRQALSLAKGRDVPIEHPNRIVVPGIEAPDQTAKQSAPSEPPAKEAPRRSPPSELPVEEEGASSHSETPDDDHSIWDTLTGGAAEGKAEAAKAGASGKDAATGAASESKAGKTVSDIRNAKQPTDAGEAADTAVKILHLPKVPEVNSPMEYPLVYAKTYWKVLSMNIIGTIVSVASSVIFVLLFACCYKYYKEDPPAPLPLSNEHNPEKLDQKQWVYGVFECFSASKTMCCLACFCPALRWADTMRMAGIYAFWVGILLFASLSAAGQATAGITSLILLCVLVRKRQEIRALFYIPSGTIGTYVEDCCLYCFCSCCAILQEARQMEEAYGVQHKIVMRIPRMMLRSK